MNSSSTKRMTLFRRSHVEFENCMIINNRAQKYGIVYVLDYSILNINQTLFKNNTIQPGAVIQVQSSSLFLLGNITIVGNRCYLGVIYAFHATVTNHGRLNISANQGIHYNVYFAQSKVFSLEFSLIQAIMVLS